MVEGEGLVTLSRRDWYPRFAKEAPTLEIPPAGQYLWDWYMDITRRVRRVADGVCGPIPPSDWLGWQQITGNIVYPWEYDILAAMDVAFCDEMNKELDARREAHQEEAQKKTKGKR